MSLHVLEYDTRFEKFGDDFVFYDYNKPLELPKDMEHSYDLVVVDPPFLSEECLTKTAITVRFMAKEKILLCTGIVYNHLSFFYRASILSSILLSPPVLMHSGLICITLRLDVTGEKVRLEIN